MTVNSAFELEDDDFFLDTFRSIPEKDLLSSSFPSFDTNQTSSKSFQSGVSSKALVQTNITSTSCKSDSPNLLHQLNNNKDSAINTSNILFSSNTPDTGQKSNQLKKNPEELLKINNRFMPGFTPKSRKRKFPGPAGVLSQEEPSADLVEKSCSAVTKDCSTTIATEDIVSSQFSGEELLLPSWLKLQTDVSSHQSLLSTAKHYSICRVINETSKKKLPKHIVVPVICVLIKKFDEKDLTSVFMDDTGEISGKIDKEVLDVHKGTVKEGTALVLKEVTFLCNILLLKTQNIVTIYSCDETVKHVQKLDALFDKGPLGSLNCECSGSPCSSKLNLRTSNEEPALKRCSHKLQVPDSSTIKSADFRMKQSSSSNEMSALKNASNEIVTDSDSDLDDLMNSLVPSALTTTSVNQGLQQKNKVTEAGKIVNEPVNEMDLFCEDSAMDDFDELLGNLDERSFMDA